MKIVIDTSPLTGGHKARGIGTYTRCLAKALDRVRGEKEIILTGDSDSLVGVDLIHYPYFDLFNARTPIIKQANKEVITIHDLTPLKLPELFKLGLRSGLNMTYQKWRVKKADAIITDSKCSRDDIVALLNVPSEKVHTVYLGVDKGFAPSSVSIRNLARRKYKLPQEYLLYVGDVNSNKNLEILIRIMSQITGIALVLVSRAMANKNLPESKVLWDLIDNLGIGDRVRVLSRVPLDDIEGMAAIYSSAAIYIQPSLYEGFGLPVLEAMACGAPVISSNRGSLPEVVGNAGVLVDPDVKSIKENVVRILKDHNLRRKLSAMGLSRSKLFTWEKCAKQTMAIYESVLAG